MTCKNFRVKGPFWGKRIFRVFFELFVYLVLLELGLRIGGFIFLSLAEYKNRTSIIRNGEYRIMCLGESSTATGGDNSYPSQLERTLNRSGIGIKFSVINAGLPGVNTTVILNQLEDGLDRYRPNMVITMMGISDPYSLPALEYRRFSRTTDVIHSLRTYKLAKLIWQQISFKLREAGSSLPKNNNLPIEKPRRNIQAAVGKEAPTPNRNLTAQIVLKNNLKLHPGSDIGYIELGKFCMGQGKFAMAERAYKKSLSLNPRNKQIYLHLGILYIKLKRYAEAEQMLKRSIALFPGHNVNSYIRLGELYALQKRYPEAEQMLKKATSMLPNCDLAFTTLARMYGVAGNEKLSIAYEEKANNIREQYYHPVTVANYNRLKDILDGRGIRLVCVQYPLWGIKPLKNIFEGKDGVIFVDNEQTFKNAVKNNGYNRYFLDMHGGNFGHCTWEGNRLLAENIANVLLNRVFRK